MNRAEIIELVVKKFEKVAGKIKEENNNLSFYYEFGLDSLDIISSLMNIEEEYTRRTGKKLRFSDDFISSSDLSVSKIVEYIENDKN